MTVSVASVGELLWDVFPRGEYLGGAPANLAFHAGQLGARATLYSAVGRDARGERALADLEGRGVRTHRIQRRPERPTGTVLVSFVREEPRYAITEDVAWDRMVLKRSVVDEWRRENVVAFGTLAQRRSDRLATFVERLRELRSYGSVAAFGGAGSARPLLVYDVNLRPPHTPLTHVEKLLRLADVVKVNEDELATLERELGPGMGPGALLAFPNVQLVAVTRAERGASLHSKHVDLDHPGFPSTGAHPVGAGDAFTAALALALASGASPTEALERANRRAAWVASLPGAMPRAVSLAPGETRTLTPHELNDLLARALAVNEHFVDLAPLFGIEGRLDVGVTDLHAALLGVVHLPTDGPGVSLRWASGALTLRPLASDGPSATLRVTF